MTITVEMAPELEQQLRQAAAQAGLAPDVYIVETLRQRLTLSPPPIERLAATEAQLLLHINQSLDGIAWSRYRDLVEKRQAETLTPAEQQELLVLTDQIELANVERMTHLVALARLRQTTLPVLIRKLGLQPNHA